MVNDPVFFNTQAMVASERAGKGLGVTFSAGVEIVECTTDVFAGVRVQLGESFDDLGRKLHGAILLASV